jgi:tetratricopeptide (TPR) repeat protein
MRAATFRTRLVGISDEPGVDMARLRFAAALIFLGVLVFASAPALAERADWVRTESFRLLNEGAAALNRGDYPTAVDKLRRAAGMALNNFRAHYFLGRALLGDRRYAEAVEALQVALDLDPSHLEANVALGNAFLRMGDTQEAPAAYYRALGLRAEYPSALDGLARTYESQGKLDEAITFFNRAIASNRGYADAYTNLGDLYLRNDRFDEAVRLLSEAVSIRADFAPGYNRLALAYSRLGLHNEAVATVQKAISLQPRAAEHQATLGTIRLALGLLSSAEAAYRAARELDPGLPEAHEGLAEVARRQGRYDDALAELDKALGDDRLDAATRARLERRRFEVETEHGTVGVLEAVVASGEATPIDYRALAAVYAGRLRWDRAAELQKRSEPEGEENERLAYYLLRAGRYREARDAYAALVARDGSRADLQLNLGVAMAGLGDDAGAAEAYRQALALDPEGARPRLYLGNALLRLGRRDEAVDAYREFLQREPQGESAQRIRRVLKQLVAAPDPLPPSPATTARTERPS